MEAEEKAPEHHGKSTGRDEDRTNEIKDEAMTRGCKKLAIEAHQSILELHDPPEGLVDPLSLDGALFDN